MSKTEMVANKSETKMVKIKTLREISVNGKIVNPGLEVEVTEEEAKMFCDTSFTGHYAGRGEGEFKLADIRRAVRV